MKTGIRMIILSNLLLGDSIIESFQERLKQIDITDPIAVKNVLASTYASPDYIQLGILIRILEN